MVEVTKSSKYIEYTNIKKVLLSPINIDAFIKRKLKYIVLYHQKLNFLTRFKISTDFKSSLQ